MREELQEMINRGVGVVPGAGLSRGPVAARTSGSGRSVKEEGRRASPRLVGR